MRRHPLSSKLPRRVQQPSKGFTLIEIVMVLLIAAMVTAGAIGAMIYSSDERALKRASGEIELLARRARTIAQLQQTPYALEFVGQEVHLLPYSEALQDPAQRISQQEWDARKAEQQANGQAQSRFFPLHSSWVADPDMSLSLKHWASDTWIPLSDRTRQIWRFEPDGLCEPISLKIDRGKSHVTSDFHPLTATVRDSELEVN
jgi:prepilin-type N-terminal cleavage/methylation domain-containing protein